MTKIMNNTESTLYVGKTRLAPNVETDVPNFDKVKSSGAVPVWLEKGVITEAKKKTKAKAKPKAKPEQTPEPAAEQVSAITGADEIDAQE